MSENLKKLIAMLSRDEQEKTAEEIDYMEKLGEAFLAGYLTGLMEKQASNIIPESTYVEHLMSDPIHGMRWAAEHPNYGAILKGLEAKKARILGFLMRNRGKLALGGGLLAGAGIGAATALKVKKSRKKSK